VRTFLVIISILIFVLNVPLLKLAYPTAETDYSVFIDVYYAKEKINEVLISLLFLIAFLSDGNRLIKAICTFGFTITFSSMIDKVFLQNFNYLYSDIIIVIFALTLSIKIYAKHPSRNKRLSN